MTTLWFVRHAVTSHTGKKLSGWAEGIDLTEEGRREADDLADALARVRFAAIYASPLDRTLQTAKRIAATRGMQVETSRALGEVEYGRWTNRSMKVLMRTKLWTKVQQWPSAARFPEGETLREVQARAVGEIERIAEEHAKGHVCCVSHGDVIRLVVAHYLGVHIDLFQRIEVSPGSVSIVALTERGPRILTVNASPRMFKSSEDVTR